MTIYQEEMQRKANHHECEATYDETTGRLRITYDGQHLMDMDERGYLYYTTQDQPDEDVEDLRTALLEEGREVREYVGAYEAAPQMKPKDVRNYRKLAEFRDTVFAAMYSPVHGFMFCTWKQNANGTSVAHGDYSQNYDAAEGLLTATILLAAEFCEPKKRHIVSVFKVIQELLAPSQKKGKNQFQQLMEMLPNDHKAKWFAGAALNTSDQSMASVMSTTLSRLNSFLDSELEQLLCFDTEIDAEKFCNEKSAIFIIMPEENPNTFFMISLIIQQLYREILAVADEQGGKLKNRCVFFCDEFGTLPKIESAEMMFSASRSRRLQIVPIIQSFSQLEKNYGKEGAEIIVDNTQLTIFGGFAPNSSSAEVLSKALGSRTVMSGSVSRSKNDPPQSLQMMERPLLTPDELKSLPKGEFVVMKTGVHPMRVKLKLFFKWGIEFDEKHPYTVPDNGGRTVEYAERKEIVDGIMKKYPPKRSGKEETRSTDTAPAGQEQSQRHEPKKVPAAKPSEKKGGGEAMRPVPPSRRTPLNKQGGMPHEPS